MPTFHGRRPSPRVTLVTALLAAAVALAPPACTTSTDSSSAKKPAAGARSNIPDPGPDVPGRKTAPLDPVNDPCADRLHAVSGALLYYYVLNKRMPQSIEELRSIAGPDPDVEFTCPVSGKPYVYDPRGLARSGNRPGYIVLYDPEPSHSGMRWAVTAEETRNKAQPLVTHVVIETEAHFHGGTEPATGQP